MACLMFHIVLLLGACGIVTPLPTVTATRIPSLTFPSPSITPFPVNTATQTATVTPLPSSTPYSCEFTWDVPWIILDDDTFRSFGSTTSVEIDEQLIQRNPQWQNFRQTVITDSWTAGVVFAQGYGAPGEYGVNPIVLMVTIGMELDWQVPPDGDLYGRVVETGKTLFAYSLEYHDQEDVREAYPQIGNAATYALYRYFNGDLSKLEIWCRTYVRVYNESPLI